MIQGNMIVSGYYTILRMLRDELLCLIHIPYCSYSVCNCDAIKHRSEIIFSCHLIQFLMGFNDRFDHIQNLTLLIEPLLIVNDALC